MTKSNRFHCNRWKFCWCLPLVLFLAGCRTARIDWNARLGHFTYDQAVIELGPPDRAADLTDHTKVAEWLSYRGQSSVYLDTFPTGFYHRAYGMGWHHGHVYRGPDRFLRLVFDPEGRLKAWQWVSR